MVKWKRAFLLASSGIWGESPTPSRPPEGEWLALQGGRALCLEAPWVCRGLLACKPADHRLRMCDHRQMVRLGRSCSAMSCFHILINFLFRFS